MRALVVLNPPQWVIRCSHGSTNGAGREGLLLLVPARSAGKARRPGLPGRRGAVVLARRWAREFDSDLI